MVRKKTLLEICMILPLDVFSSLREMHQKAICKKSSKENFEQQSKKGGMVSAGGFQSTLHAGDPA
jgi:hypothetical protein